VSDEPLNLADRMALRPKEVARALGLSERTVRQILPELPTVRVGSVVLVPKEMLERWLQEQAETQEGRIDTVVDEVMKDFDEDHRESE
jgi:excisionase family DNA binding protein